MWPGARLYGSPFSPYLEPHRGGAAKNTAGNSFSINWMP